VEARDDEEEDSSEEEEESLGTGGDGVRTRVLNPGPTSTVRGEWNPGEGKGPLGGGRVKSAGVPMGGGGLGPVI